MDKIIIEGGKHLSGEVEISGAKNAALPIMAAAILASGPITLENVPNLKDLATMGSLLSHMGGRTEMAYPQVALDLSGLNQPEAPYELVKTMRASALVLGPLLSRFGRAKVSLPGGCAIGARPIDLHLKALERMGAKIDLAGGYVVAVAPKGGLRGAQITFDLVTVTGTSNLMMAACLARGQTVLKNAAKEPEVMDTARALTAMGAVIAGVGTDTLVIDGVDELKAAGHRIMPDRIEAGTILTAVGLAGGDIILKNVPHEALGAVYGKLTEMGLRLEPKGDRLRAQSPGHLAAVNITTQPFPGFPTDMQAQFMALATRSQGTSLITENIFENRFMHVSELSRLGADITLEGRTAIVKGVKHLSGAPVMATDLRASASLIVAALAAKGQTEVQRVYHLDRGYDRLDEKLNRLGAKIKRAPA